MRVYLTTVRNWDWWAECFNSETPTGILTKKNKLYTTIFTVSREFLEILLAVEHSHSPQKLVSPTGELNKHYFSHSCCFTSHKSARDLHQNPLVRERASHAPDRVLSSRQNTAARVHEIASMAGLLHSDILYSAINSFCIITFNYIYLRWASVSTKWRC